MGYQSRFLDFQAEDSSSYFTHYIQSEFNSSSARPAQGPPVLPGVGLVSDQALLRSVATEGLIEYDFQFIDFIALVGILVGLTARFGIIFGITFGVVTVVLFVLAGAGASDAVAMPVAFAWLLTLPLAVFFGIARLIEKLRSK